MNLEQLSIELQVPVGHALDAVRLVDGAARRSAESLAGGRILRAPCDGGCELVVVARVHEEAVLAVLDEVDIACDPGHHARQSVRHGLEERVRHALGMRGEDEQVGFGEAPWNVGDLTAQVDDVCNSELLGLRPERLPQRTVPEEGEAKRDLRTRRPRLRHGADQDVEPFLRVEPSDEDDVECLPAREVARVVALGLDVAGLDAVRRHDDALARNAGSLELVDDRLVDGDESVGLERLRQHLPLAGKHVVSLHVGDIARLAAVGDLDDRLLPEPLACEHRRVRRIVEEVHVNQVVAVAVAPQVPVKGEHVQVPAELPQPFDTEEAPQREVAEDGYGADRLASLRAALPPAGDDLDLDALLDELRGKLLRLPLGPTDPRPELPHHHEDAGRARC